MSDVLHSFVDRHGTSGQRVTKTRFVYLPVLLGNAYSVVLSRHALALNTEYSIKFLPVAGSKCRSFHGDLTVEFVPINGCE